MDAYRFGLTWDNRPRFRVRNTQAAVLEEQTDCQAAAAIQAQLRVTDLAGVGPACPRCVDSATARPPVRLEAALPPSETQDARYLREVRVLVDDEWRTVASEEFTVQVPEWAAAEPLWSLIALMISPIVVLAGASLAAVRVVRHRLDDYEEEPTSVRHLGIVGADGMGMPIVRLGLFVWRRADIEHGGESGVSRAYVSLAWLVAGSLVARFYSPPAPRDALDETQPPNRLSDVARQALAILRGARTLVVGRRLTYASFETADGRDNELRLVSRIGHEGTL